MSCFTDLNRLGHGSVVLFIFLKGCGCRKNVITFGQCTIKDRSILHETHGAGGFIALCGAPCLRTKMQTGRLQLTGKTRLKP